MRTNLPSILGIHNQKAMTVPIEANRAHKKREVEAHPKLRKFIENKCQTCHAPMAKTQSKQDGMPELSLAKAKQMPLAADGVSCTLCHQIQPGNLGTRASFSGHYEIHQHREIFGPYDEVFAGPMMRHVNYTPQLGRHVQDSKLCATCAFRRIRSAS